jgi:hypothetical protein
MRRLTFCAATLVASALVLGLSPHRFDVFGEALAAGALQSAGGPKIDLAQQLTAGKLRAVNRDVGKVADNSRPGIHLSEKAGNGVAWVEGSDFGEGTIELDIRGRDVMGGSFVGVAFHRKDDNTYEAVYLRPFNFKNPDVARRQNAVQYIALPDYDWPRLRKEFPSEFENPVDESLVPTDWVPVRLVVNAKTVQVFVGAGAKTPALEVRKLGTDNSGQVGLWAGNNSEGDYANLRITPKK